MTNDTDAVAATLGDLSDDELLGVLNAALAKRQRPPTAEEIAAKQEREAAADYQRYYPGGRR